MEESLKYFQPDILDIRVGYECEMHTMTTGGLMILDMSENGKSETIKKPDIEIWEKVKCGVTWDERSPDNIQKDQKQVKLEYPI